MDEQNIPDEEFEIDEPYTPRPRWQVWTARVAVVIMIIGVLLYYYWIAHRY